MVDISVIICTRNPRMDYLTRVLSALREQTLPKDQWELVIVDNASDEALQGRLDLSWHSCARVVREEEMGLTPARLRGIREIMAELLIFVDDDNVLAIDYLEKAVQIASEWPKIGVWGGNSEAEFEKPVPTWVMPYWVRQHEQDYWSNDYGCWKSQPFGAGMCVRRIVAEEYSKKVQGDRIRTALGRKGDNLMGCEDTDLVFTAPSLGLGFGVFRTLKLLHLVPNYRTEEQYLLNLTMSTWVSEYLLRFARTGELPPKRFKLRTKVADVLRAVLLPPRERKFLWARRKSAFIAARKITELSND